MASPAQHRPAQAFHAITESFQARDGPSFGPRPQEILKCHRADERLPSQFVNPQADAAADGDFVEQAVDGLLRIRCVLDDADAVNEVKLSFAERQLVKRSLDTMEARVAAEIGTTRIHGGTEINRDYLRARRKGDFGEPTRATASVENDFA